MRWCFLFMFLVFMVSGATAQMTTIFKNKQDSVDFASLELKLKKRSDYISDKGGKKAMAIRDSINAVRQQFLSDHQHLVRMTYQQNRSFTPYQLLPSIANKDSIQKISINGNGRRTTIPDSIFMYRNLSDLELIDFRMSELPKQINELPLKRITISNNFPKKRLRLPKNGSITTLTIRGDEENKLPKSYRKLKNLEVLELSRNNLTKIPVVKKNDKLMRYELTFNSITVVPSWLGKMKSLKNLNLNNNKVELIKPGIEKIKGLEELQLYRNNLKTLPPMLYSMTSLKVIDLYYNHIYSLTGQIANWKNLEILYLSNNDLVSIPEEINQLTNLKELYIHHNNLSKIPSLWNLTGVYTLRINDNFLTEFPEGIENMKNLSYFDCSFNRLKKLPISQLTFENMKTLYLHANPWDVKMKEQMLMWVTELRKRDAYVTFEND